MAVRLVLAGALIALVAGGCTAEPAARDNAMSVSEQGRTSSSEPAPSLSTTSPPGTAPVAAVAVTEAAARRTTTTATPRANATTAPTAPPSSAVTLPSTTEPTFAPVGPTGVTGLVTTGPTCGVELEGKPCPDAPVQAVVEAVGRSGVAGKDATDDTGRYAMELPPGTYTIRVVVAGRYPMCPEIDVAILPGRRVTADILCDSGIRVPVSPP